MIMTYYTSLVCDEYDESQAKNDVFGLVHYLMTDDNEARCRVVEYIEYDEYDEYDAVFVSCSMSIVTS